MIKTNPSKAQTLIEQYPKIVKSTMMDLMRTDAKANLKECQRLQKLGRDKLFLYKNK